MKKGFTLIEVLIVVIILGILATIAIPQFAKTVERSRNGEATTIIGAIQTAEQVYRLDLQTYTTLLGNLDCTIGAKNWSYTILAGSDTFTITATRNSGSYSNNTITYSELGVWAGTYPFKPS